MTRGHMKMQAKEKNMKKQEALRKAQGFDHKGAQQKSLNYKCPICMAQNVHLKSYKEHFTNKHPNAPLPPELAEA
uniref:4F5 domain-containing protein n=1 Tax=Steinernema glaseri TaxID=37863 RepID=A0A1I7ZP00_9BILA